MCSVHTCETQEGNLSVASLLETRYPLIQALDTRLAHKALDTRLADPQASREPSRLRFPSCAAAIDAPFCVWFDVDLGDLNSGPPAYVSKRLLCRALSPTQFLGSCVRRQRLQRGLIPLSGTYTLGKSMWSWRCVGFQTVVWNHRSLQSPGLKLEPLSCLWVGVWAATSCPRSDLVLGGQSGDVTLFAENAAASILRNSCQPALLCLIFSSFLFLYSRLALLALLFTDLKQNNNKKTQT